LKFFNRGLLALIITLFVQSTLFAEYLYKDDVVSNPKFTNEVNTLGKELYEKTGISLRLVMVREIPTGLTIVEFEKKMMEKFKEPTILLTFSELDSKVDILASDRSLYEYFNKKQILSPVASPVQAFMMAIFYSDSFDSFIATIQNYGGTIIPLLAGKAKKGELLGKYSGSMFNGYADIAEQIAQNKNIILENAVGNANKIAITVIKVIFYGVIFMALIMYIKRQLFYRKEKNESK